MRSFSARSSKCEVRLCARKCLTLGSNIGVQKIFVREKLEKLTEFEAQLVGPEVCLEVCFPPAVCCGLGLLCFPLAFVQIAPCQAETSRVQAFLQHQTTANAAPFDMRRTNLVQRPVRQMARIPRWRETMVRRAAAVETLRKICDRRDQTPFTRGGSL